MRRPNLITLTIFLLILHTITVSSSVTLQCNFISDGWDFAVKDAYMCRAKSVNFQSKVLITNVEGQHVGANTNNRVNAFLIFEQTCEYFPSGIEKFFPKLEGIAIQKSKLKVIRRNDLKPFTELKSLSFHSNQLVTLGFELLKHNQKLQIFSIFFNKVTSIAEDIFDGLNDLKEVHFQTNICINMTAKNRTQIDTLKAQIHKNCSSTVDMKSLFDLEVAYEKLESVLDQKSLELATCKADSQVHVTTQIPATTAIATTTTTSDPCEARYEKLTEIVKKFDIECDDFYDSTCVANDVIIQHENMEPRTVRIVNGSQIDPAQVMELEIRGKNVHFMPEKLGIFFKNLQNLTISSTRITKIGEKSLEKLGDLVSLSLTGNRIQVIHQNAFSDLKNCELLDLSGNKLTEIPDAISAMHNIKELNLEQNQIVILNWKTFENLGNLEELRVSENRLKQIGSNLQQRNLMILDLTGNICVDMKYPDETMESMVEHFVENCTVEVDLKCEFKVDGDDYVCIAVDFDISSENTKIARISGQHAAQKTIKDVTKFSSTNQNLQFIPQNLQNFFPKLSKLEIVSSNLQKLSTVKNLNWIRITGNNLDKIDNFSFADALELQHIDLSANKITKIPENLFADLSNLRFLNLNRNFLTSFGENLLPAANSIKEFYGSENKLQKIANKFIKNLKSANIIELIGNSCVDNKFNRLEDNSKKFMELYGEVDLNC
ncbi:leucine-rich repeat-containing protein 15-like [Chironomus tepperi]|uniref:leucine-rich repeat-containing protein 15-like n=1 Tax=Chironomus tepperi TaxID=113505 RepID=UPI00391F0666